VLFVEFYKSFPQMDIQASFRFTRVTSTEIHDVVCWLSKNFLGLHV